MSTRTFYATHYPAFAAPGSSTYRPAHGVQSVTINTNFNLEQVFELGQLEIYENVETVPEIEATIEKVLDGRELIYHLATPGATTKTLANRTNKKCIMTLSIFNDSQENSSGTPETQMVCSGMYVDSLTYSFPVDGSFTETVTLVGNDKDWRTSSFLFNGQFAGNDAPSGSIQRRQYMNMGTAGTASRWPTDIPGLTGSGHNVVTGDGSMTVHIQDVTISTNLNRNSLFEQGKRREFFRFAQFPTEVTCEIQVLTGGSTPGDQVDAIGDSQANLSDRTIILKLNDGSIFDLGTKNKLSSVTYQGGSTDGGEVIATFSYSNFNKLDITAPSDPDGLT